MAEGHGAEVKLVGLSRDYGEIAAVRELDLTVAPGEFVTLLGPSGSGKTTTLMMVAGFVQPSTGDVLLDGRSVVALAPHRRNLGVVFQSYALFPHMSVFDNVAFPLRMRRAAASEIRRRVEDALVLVQLGPLGTRRIQQLSGGQQQRVALARALVFRPPVLLMDEPLGALDRKLRDQMQLEIKRIQRTLGLTVLYVTHDQEEALILSDRIAIMHEGRLHQVGTPAGVYDRPATTFVADFVGESNMLSGLVEKTGPDGLTVRLRGSGRLLEGREGPFAPGQAVRVMIRPEAVAVGVEAAGDGDNRAAGDGDNRAAGDGDNRAAGDGDNRVQAVVEDALYLGQAIRYVVRGDDLTLVARVPRKADDVALQAGTPVTASWPAGATAVIPETA